MRLGLAALALLLPLGGTAGAADLEATLDWARRAELGTLVSGVVVAVPVAVGQRVDEGAELLRLDDRGFRAAVAEAEAAAAKFRVRLTEAQREDERAAELYDRTVLSDHERQLAAIALQEVRSDLQAAQARLVQARLDLERSHIRAPYPALVLRLDAAPGQVVVSELQSTPLVVIAEADRMRARALAAAEQLAAVKVGDAAQVEVQDRRFTGRVETLGLEPAPSAGPQALYEVTVSFEVPPDQQLRAGQPAQLRLEQGQ
jgi:multidrug efflux system membrane fusion protein